MYDCNIMWYTELINTHTKSTFVMISPTLRLSSPSCCALYSITTSASASRKNRNMKQKREGEEGEWEKEDKK